MPAYTLRHKLRYQASHSFLIHHAVEQPALGFLLSVAVELERWLRCFRLLLMKLGRGCLPGTCKMAIAARCSSRDAEGRPAAVGVQFAIIRASQHDNGSFHLAQPRSQLCSMIPGGLM